MGIVNEVDEVESLINLPLVLRILGIFVLALTIWKGVHGVPASAGILIGGMILMAAAFFSKRLNAFWAQASLAAYAVGILLLAVTIWKGVHGFFPTAGIIVGGLMLLVGGMFNKIYK